MFSNRIQVLAAYSSKQVLADNSSILRSSLFGLIDGNFLDQIFYHKKTTYSEILFILGKLCEEILLLVFSSIFIIS